MTRVLMQIFVNVKDDQVETLVAAVKEDVAALPALAEKPDLVVRHFQLITSSPD